MVVAGIDEAGDAVLEQFGGGERRRDAHVVGVERGLVGVHAVEQERLRVGLVGKPARELERRMQMAVDEARRRHGVAAVDGLLAGVVLGDLGRLADRDDLAALHGDRRIADDAAAGIDGDQPVDVGDDEIDGLHIPVSIASTASLRPHPEEARSARLEAMSARHPWTPAFDRIGVGELLSDEA